MTPVVARLLLGQFERTGLGAADWPAAAGLRRVLLSHAAGDGDAGEFERQFRALCDLHARCRREGWLGGPERRAFWREVNADLREGCLRLGAGDRWPSAPLLLRALRTALDDESAGVRAPALLSAAASQAIVAGSARRARRLLRSVEADLRSPQPVLAAGPDGIEACIACSARLSARFGPEARRGRLVTVLAAAWLLRRSAAESAEALDPIVEMPAGTTRSERDAHVIALAVASLAWELLGDARESLRLLGAARALIGRGFVRRWGDCPACADAVGRIVGPRD